MTVYQISIFLENRTGKLAEIAKILADNQIDKRAISIAETSDSGVLRPVGEQRQEATSLLLWQGLILSQPAVPVGRVRAPPGGHARA